MTDDSSSNRLSVRKRRLRRYFRFVALLFPFFLVAMSNVVCWYWNVGTDTTLVLLSERDHSGTIAYLNPRVDVAYCREDLRGPEPRGFSFPKPKKHIRVIVVGASTVQGYPYSSELSFPRQMECILQKQLPDQTVEVLNAGIVGLSAAPLADLVGQLASADPDAIVLYSGHNQFYGVGGVATNAKASALSIGMRKFRLGQLVTDLAAPAVDPNDHRILLERLPAEYAIPISSPLVAQATAQYSDVIRSIIRSCARNDMPLLLCTVASNLHGQSPHVSHEVSNRQAEVRLTIEANISTGMTEEALELAEGAVKEFPEDAVLQYRRAQILEKLGRAAESRMAYVLARDLDPCRYRAPSALGDALKAVAASIEGSHQVLDLVPVFDAASAYPAAGEDLFLEHVHFNLDGHWVAAKAVSEALMTQLWGRSWDESLIPTLTERNKFIGMLDTDTFTGLYLALSIQSSAPLNTAVDYEIHAERLQEKIASLSPRANPTLIGLFMNLPTQAKMDDPIDGMGRSCLDADDNQRASEFFALSRNRRPWLPNAFIFGAISAFQLGDSDTAVRLLRESEKTVLSESVPILRAKERLMKMMKQDSRKRE